jgi:hypothetical protein
MNFHLRRADMVHLRNLSQIWGTGPMSVGGPKDFSECSWKAMADPTPYRNCQLSQLSILMTLITYLKTSRFSGIIRASTFFTLRRSSYYPYLRARDTRADLSSEKIFIGFLTHKGRFLDEFNEA